MTHQFKKMKTPIMKRGTISLESIRLLLFLSLSFCGLLFLGSCNQEDDFLLTGSIEIEFSRDTLRFDTVFTEVGSATRSFKIYNRENQPIKLSRIYIENSNTPFRLNVDGIPGNEAEDVIIWAKDSIYVFAEVTIDPDQPLSNSPFVIEDKVIVQAGESSGSVLLEAWGQNANYFPNRFGKGQAVLLSCSNGEIIWDDPKPYVIYGGLFIDDCTLTVAPGTRIHVHGGVARSRAIMDMDTITRVFNDGYLVVRKDGQINFNGTLEEPIIIQGDRLEEPFLDEAGQWTGIVIEPQSKGNRIQYTTIKNSLFGVFVDSLAELSLQNSQIYNTNGNGLIGFRGIISATNTLIYNNGSNSVQILLGGAYDFDHCTVASYGVDASAIFMSNFFCYDDNPLNCDIFALHRLNANFRNCIFFGSSRDEVQLSDARQGQGTNDFSVSFENCIVKVDELLDQQEGLYANFFNDQCTNCFNGTNQDALFVDPNEDIYELDSLSIAINQGQSIPEITIDLLGRDRDDLPDIGCFEWIQN